MSPLSPIVVGVGYTGRRVLEHCDDERQGLGFSRRTTNAGSALVVSLNLDEPLTRSLSLPKKYTLLYTIAPSPNTEPDPRLARLLEALDPLPKRFVLISTSGVYGDCQGKKVTEQRVPQPASPRAAKRLAAEQQLSRWAEQNSVSSCILRVPGIYGPGRLGLESLRNAQPSIREQDTFPGNRIHVDDLVSCCIAAMEQGAQGGIYNVGDGDHRSSTWFTKEVARQAGLPAPPEISRAEAQRVFSPMRYSFLCESRRLDTNKMRTVLGVNPRYGNAADGIRASLIAEGLDPQG